MFTYILAWESLTVAASATVEQLAKSTLSYEQPLVEKRAVLQGHDHVFSREEAAGSARKRSAFVASIQMKLGKHNQPGVIGGDAESGHADASRSDGRARGGEADSKRTRAGNGGRGGVVHSRDERGHSGSASGSKNKSSRKQGRSKNKSDDNDDIADNEIGADSADNYVDDDVDDDDVDIHVDMNDEDADIGNKVALKDFGGEDHDNDVDEIVTSTDADTRGSATGNRGDSDSASTSAKVGTASTDRTARAGRDEADGTSPACAGEDALRGDASTPCEVANKGENDASAMAIGSANKVASTRSVALVKTAARGGGLFGARILFMLVSGSGALIFALTCATYFKALCASKLESMQRTGTAERPSRQMPLYIPADSQRSPEVVQMQRDDTVARLMLMLETNVRTCFRDNGAPAADEKDWLPSYVAVDFSESTAGESQASGLSQCNVSFWDSADARANGSLATLVWPLEVIDEIGPSIGRPDIVVLSGGSRNLRWRVRRRGLLGFNSVEDAQTWAESLRAVIDQFRKNGTSVSASGSGGVDVAACSTSS
eukprot:TRINITY_DN13221_c0_g1_i1.p1 TRINITY_DN13221_c0_g1~~TRINITY_DN13221_c0_g1_i1.p1  ORF type:complete len:546 (+),score=101.82 TRINITY_DN13221_c0_g1_i1:96-1733(+)